jgi:phosphoglycerate dehydrogenase-like enzyme
MLALARRLPEAIAAQRAHRWERDRMQELSGASVLVVGLGPIGSGVVERCRAFGMHVEAMRRSPDGTEDVPTHRYDVLADIVGRFDWLVLAAPLSPLTEGLVSARVLDAMRPGARLVNIARGAMVDEAALVEALRRGHLAGAYLDVTAVEPLPEDSPLWDLPSVLVTAHTSGASTANDARADAVFLDNLRRYDAGEPLRNEVLADR